MEAAAAVGDRCCCSSCCCCDARGQWRCTSTAATAPTASPAAATPAMMPAMAEGGSGDVSWSLLLSSSESPHGPPSFLGGGGGDGGTRRQSLEGIPSVEMRPRHQAVSAVVTVIALTSRATRLTCTTTNNYHSRLSGDSRLLVRVKWVY